MDRKPAPRAERRRLTHVDRTGRPRMVDVSAKPPTARRAVAEAFVACSAETLSLIVDGATTKGDVLTVAELAGVMAGKRTSELIPLCHPIALTDLLVQVVPDRAAGGLRIRSEAATVGSDRGRDGGPDGRVRGRAHRLRYGQGSRARGRDPVGPARLQERWQERRVGPTGGARIGSRGRRRSASG